MGSFPEVGGWAFKDWTVSTPKGLAFSLLWSRVSHEFVLMDLEPEEDDELVLPVLAEEEFALPEGIASALAEESCDFLTG